MDFPLGKNNSKVNPNPAFTKIKRMRCASRCKRDWRCSLENTVGRKHGGGLVQYTAEGAKMGIRLLRRSDWPWFELDGVLGVVLNLNWPCARLVVSYTARDTGPFEEWGKVVHVGCWIVVKDGILLCALFKIVSDGARHNDSPSICQLPRTSSTLLRKSDISSTSTVESAGQGRLETSSKQTSAHNSSAQIDQHDLNAHSLSVSRAISRSHKGGSNASDQLVSKTRVHGFYLVAWKRSNLRSTLVHSQFSSHQLMLVESTPPMGRLLTLIQTFDRGNILIFGFEVPA